MVTLQNNQRDYDDNLPLSVNIDSEDVPVPSSENQNTDMMTNNQILHSSPQQMYLPQQYNPFHLNQPLDNEDDNDYYQVETQVTNS